MLGLDVALPIPIKPAPCCTECVQSRPPASFSLACRRVPICPQVRQDVVQPQWTFPEFGSCIIVRRRRSIRWVSRASVKPTGVTWVYEIKHDGFRMMVRRDAAGVRLLTRNGIDWTTHFAFIAEAAAALRVKYFLIDGEAVCCDGDGMPVFDRLRYRRDDRHVFLYAFDVLQLDSRDLRLVSIGVGMGPPVLPHLRMLPVGCLRTLADGPTLRAGTGRGAVGGSGRA